MLAATVVKQYLMIFYREATIIYNNSLLPTSSADVLVVILMERVLKFPSYCNFTCHFNFHDNEAGSIALYFKKEKTY